VSIICEPYGIKNLTVFPTKMVGIDGYGVCIYKSKIKVRFFNEEKTIRCVFSERDDIPFILGRLDILDKYNMLFFKNEVCLEQQ